MNPALGPRLNHLRRVQWASRPSVIKVSRSARPRLSPAVGCPAGTPSWASAPPLKFYSIARTASAGRPRVARQAGSSVAP